MLFLTYVCILVSAAKADLEGHRFINVFLHYLNDLDSTSLQLRHDFGSVAPPYLQGDRQISFWKPFDLQPGSRVSYQPDYNTTIVELNIKMENQIGIWPQDKSILVYLWGCQFKMEYKIIRSDRLAMEPSTFVTSCNKVQYQTGTQRTTDVPYLQRTRILDALSSVLLDKIKLYFSYFGDEKQLSPSFVDLQRIFRLSMLKTAIVY